MRFKTLIIWMKKIVIFVISFESNWHAFNWKSCSIILLNKQALRIQPPTHKFYGDVAIADISINHYTLYESNITHGFVSAGIHTFFSAHHHFTTFIWKIWGPISQTTKSLKDFWGVNVFENVVKWINKNLRSRIINSLGAMTQFNQNDFYFFHG